MVWQKWCKTNLKRSSAHKRENICSPITQNFWWKSEFSGKFVNGASLLPIILPPVLATGFSPYTIQQPFPAISQQLIFKQDMVFQMLFPDIFEDVFPDILPPVLATGFFPSTIYQPFPAISQQLIFRRKIFSRCFLKMCFPKYVPFPKYFENAFARFSHKVESTSPSFQIFQFQNSIPLNLIVVHSLPLKG